MAESQEHIRLVNLVYKKVCKLVPESKTCLVEKDSPENRKVGYNVQGFIPDVYYWQNNLFIIGEAKTLKDFSSRHSKLQLRAYIDECQKFIGTAYIILAVPWPLKNTALNYFRKIRNNEDVNNSKFIVVDELGSEFEV